jgi:hypothetical protein
MAEASPKTYVSRDYYLHVAVMVERSIDRVIAVLVKRGYTVGPLSKDLKTHISNENNVATLLSLRVTAVVDSADKSPLLTVFADIRDVLKVTDIKFFAATISEPIASSWILGNVVKAPEVTAEAKKGMN